MKIIGRNINSNDEASVVSGISVGSGTSVVIAAANPNRIAFSVNNNLSNKACWIKLQPAATDDDKKGIFLHKKKEGVGVWDMTPDNTYTGEISAISDSGTATVYVTEY